MSHSPLITVVMPVLNAAAHLPRSLASLAEQSCREFEVVLVDGASTDQTVALASELLSRAAIPFRLEVVPASGIYEAMNHGVAMASGEWLYVMGSDDRLWDADVFASMAPTLRRVEPDVLVVHADVWIEDPGYFYGSSWDLPRFLERNISHQSAFYRRRPIRALAIDYDSRYPLYADWDYNLKLFARGRFQYVARPVASYACSGTSAGRVDERFMAEKESNAIRYFGWRSCWLMPPHRFAMGYSQQPTLRMRVGLQLNRLLWLLRRLGRR